MTSPSAILVAAADRIRDLAAAWESANEDRGYTWDHVTGFTSDDYDDEPLNSAQHWMRALSPAVAPHLEAIFRQAAKEAADHEEDSAMAEVGYCPLEKSVMALAHALCPELVEEDQK